LGFFDCERVLPVLLRNPIAHELVVATAVGFYLGVTAPLATASASVQSTPPGSSPSPAI
jgi:hypothetical protein